MNDKRISNAPLGSKVLSTLGVFGSCQRMFTEGGVRSRFLGVLPGPGPTTKRPLTATKPYPHLDPFSPASIFKTRLTFVLADSSSEGVGSRQPGSMANRRLMVANRSRHLSRVAPMSRGVSPEPGPKSKSPVSTGGLGNQLLRSTIIGLDCVQSRLKADTKVP